MAESFEEKGRKQQMGRLQVQVERGAPHGDLFELEQTTSYRVVDTLSGDVLLTFQGEMEASLSSETGLWDDYRFSGVCEVLIAPDEQSVIVRYCDGREEALPLPRGEE